MSIWNHTNALGVGLSGIASTLVKGVSHVSDAATGTIDLTKSILKPVTNTISDPLGAVKGVAKAVAHPILAGQQLAHDTQAYALNIGDDLRKVASGTTFGLIDKTSLSGRSGNDPRNNPGPLAYVSSPFGGKKSIKNRRNQKRNSKKTNLRRKSRK